MYVRDKASREILDEVACPLSGTIVACLRDTVGGCWDGAGARFVRVSRCSRFLVQSEYIVYMLYRYEVKEWRCIRDAFVMRRFL